LFLNKWLVAPSVKDNQKDQQMCPLFTALSATERAGSTFPRKLTEIPLFKDYFITIYQFIKFKMNETQVNE